MLRSTFYGLNIASKGLFVSQRQIDVTAHNVANANVEGYSRQRYITSSVEPGGIPAQFADTTRGQVGDGVQTLSLDQIRDMFLDQQYRGEQPKAQYWETRSNAMYYIEDVFNATDSSSLDGVISSFFNAVQELSKDTTSESVRTNVLAEARKMVDLFHMYNTQLTELMQQQDSNMVEQTKNANQLITNLANLNDKIFKYELGGSVANDLRDQRNLILDKLSALMNITYTETSFDPPAFNLYGKELTQMKVYVGRNAGEDYEDYLLCSHMDPYLFTYEEESGLNDIADNNDPQVITNTVYLASGEKLGEEIEGFEGGILKSYMDMRDSTDPLKPGIPYFIEQLNLMVDSMVRSFNEIHSQGYTMPYDNASGSSGSTTGIDFFDSEGLTAGTMAISADILESVFNIACSSEYVTRDSDGHLQTGNNVNVLAIITGVKENSAIDGIDNSFEGFFKNFLGYLASETAESNAMRDGQSVLMESLTTQRMSVMSVSVDEEMTGLIRFQHAYNASARAITTLDEMLDKLINGTGRVGL